MRRSSYCINRNGVWVFAAIILVAPFYAYAGETEKTDETQKVRVMTFNIRLGSANDGPDRWEVRAPRVIETIRESNSDVVGLQEAESFQTRALLAALPRYAAVGVSREDGRVKGEACVILFDRARFSVESSGTFWLSDTPAQPGSITWDNVCTRICTWARLIEWESGRGLYVYNLHFDHVGQDSRERAALLVRQHFNEHVANAGVHDPLVVMGDFNVDEENPALATLLHGDNANAKTFKLRDSYRVLHAGARAGTFTGFKVENDGGTRKIDYVLIGPGLRVTAADIDQRKVDGRWPSDHFPVWAELAWERKVPDPDK
ncbi:MAG: endonuclease/exonuclease/phosphatase family protein [Phycisphaerae bacterium]